LRFIARAIDLASEVLPTPGRAGEGEDGRLRLLDQGADGEELEDAVLDLLEAVVVLVEDLLGALQIAALLGLLVPGTAISQSR
jgi:hypothetical protein